MTTFVFPAKENYVTPTLPQLVGSSMAMVKEDGSFVPCIELVTHSCFCSLIEFQEANVVTNQYGELMDLLELGMMAH